VKSIQISLLGCILRKTVTFRAKKHSISALNGMKNQPDTYQKYPDAYYKHVYISKNLYEGIELVAGMEHISKKQAARWILEAGFSSLMGKKLVEHIEDEQRIKELNLERHPYLSRFARMAK
jgi:hypothetical protein